MNAPTPIQLAARRAVQTLHDECMAALASVKLFGKSIRLPGWPPDRINRVADALAALVETVVDARLARTQLRRVS